ncbi:TspO and MBR related proteins [Desulfonatronum thiosulfatophilum]|uniref:TspO and MBR related proteins n=1 Tax=Desulfonatronum thiosulfatophilum TaxID=617002 RepID=A0A1G6CLZ4_9BACT|nr:TspO/MBR family protein [Desulfonatronum thiosulfatophilum]SDB33921.1 TspO and MBR related proteins [Desulfonatronum thiosulfatophilum]
MEKRKQILGLIGWLAITYVAAAVGSAASMDAPALYAQLDRPAWSPPAQLFGPVWTVLYTLMGVAAWLVWRVGTFRETRTALGLFIVQLFFNALWSWLFFVWNLGMVSFAGILLLLGLIFITMISFWNKRPLAGALLIPYLLWVGYASILNYTLWRLNPHILG